MALVGLSQAIYNLYAAILAKFPVATADIAANAATKVTTGTITATSTTSTTPVAFANIPIVGGGGYHVLICSGFANNSTIANTVLFYWNIDSGGNTNVDGFSSAGAGYYASHTVLVPLGNLSGSHTINITWSVGAGTGTFAAGAAPIVMEFKR